MKTIDGETVYEPADLDEAFRQAVADAEGLRRARIEEASRDLPQDVSFATSGAWIEIPTWQNEAKQGSKMKNNVGLTQKGVNATQPRRGARASRSKPSSGVKPQAVAGEAETLTFVTTEGERIVFDGMGIPVGEAAALAGEEALGRVWDRPAEDLAWRDMQKAT